MLHVISLILVVMLYRLCFMILFWWSSISMGSSSVVVLDVMLYMFVGLYSAHSSLVLSFRLEMAGVRGSLSAVVLLVLVFVFVFVSKVGL